jgi:hypothetical protein
LEGLFWLLVSKVSVQGHMVELLLDLCTVRQDTMAKSTQWSKMITSWLRRRESERERERKREKARDKICPSKTCLTQ